MSAVILATLLDASLRISGIALAVGVCLAAMRIRAGAVRHDVWTMVLCSMLLMPALTAVAPPIAITMPFSSPDRFVEPLPHARVEFIATAAVSSVTTTAAPGAPAAEFESAPVSVSDYAALLYIAIAAVLLCRCWVGWRGVARFVREARSISPAVAESAAVAAPVTIGLLHPIVLLPLEWRTWPADKQQAVLAHELAHARRRDPLIVLLARINCCVFWFHPLAWWLDRTLTTHAEYAADDAALRAGAEPRRYAHLLLDFARVVSERRGRLITSVGMNADGRLERRITRIVSGGPFGTAPRWRTVAVSSVCAAAIVVGAACRLDSGSPRFATSAAIESRDRTLRQRLAQLEEEQRTGDGLDHPDGLSARLNELWIRPDIEARRAAILRLIESHPEGRLAGSVRARLFPVALEPSFPGDPSGYQRARTLWLARTARSDADPRVLANAAGFLAGDDADRPIAEELLLRARRTEPDGPWVVHLGRLYAGALASFLVLVTPQSARYLPAPDSRTAFALHVRETLATSTDDVLLTATGWFLARASLNQPQLFGDPRPWAEDCFKRVLQLNPMAVIAHTELIHLRSQMAFQRQPLWQPPPIRQYELIASLHDEERFARLPYLARSSYHTVRDLARWDDPNLRERSDLARTNARRYAVDALRLAPKFRDHSSYGTAIYMANMTLGAIALRDGDTRAAASYLLRAADAPPSEELAYSDNLMPDWHWHLVPDLLERGERSTVATYLDRMAAVNIASRIEFKTAAAEVRQGKTPKV